jgi:hypothetical protein
LLRARRERPGRRRAAGASGPLRAFRQGLKETGHIEGENVTIAYRWAENQIGQDGSGSARATR